MLAEKSVAVSYSVPARFKALLEAAATRESRSQTNMLEALLFQHRSAHGIDIAPTAAQASSTVKCE